MLVCTALDSTIIVISRQTNICFFCVCLCCAARAVGGRLNAADPSLAFAVKVSGVCSAIALLFVPFASALEGILLIEMRWLRIAAAYSLTLPASLIAFVVAGCIDSFHKRKSLYFLQETQFVCLLWLLPLIYNVIKIAVMQIEDKKKQNIQTKQQDNIKKTAAANEDIL